MFILPTPQDNTTARVRFRTIIEDSEYVLVYDYNLRESLWSLSILDENDSELIGGIRLVPNFPLTSAALSEDLFTGSIFLSTPDDTAPTLDTISGATLYYLTAEDTAAIGALQ